MHGPVCTADEFEPCGDLEAEDVEFKREDETPVGTKVDTRDLEIVDEDLVTFVVVVSSDGGSTLEILGETFDEKRDEDCELSERVVDDPS